MRFPTAGCSSLGGLCQVDPSNGNLRLQFSAPASDLATITPVFSYNALNSTLSSEIGNGWSHTFKRTVALTEPGRLAPRSGPERFVITGAGDVFEYTTELEEPQALPTGNAVNSLKVLPASAYTEAQANGTIFLPAPLAGTLPISCRFKTPPVRPGRSRTTAACA